MYRYIAVNNIYSVYEAFQHLFFAGGTDACLYFWLYENITKQTLKIFIHEWLSILFPYNDKSASGNQVSFKAGSRN